jgi:hypothetical protein
MANGINGQVIEERIRESMELAKATARKFDTLLEILAEKGMVASGDLDRLRQIDGL